MVERGEVKALPDDNKDQRVGLPLPESLLRYGLYESVTQTGDIIREQAQKLGNYHETKQGIIANINIDQGEALKGSLEPVNKDRFVPHTVDLREPGDGQITMEITITGFINGAVANFSIARYGRQNGLLPRYSQSFKHKYKDNNHVSHDVLHGYYAMVATQQVIGKALVAKHHYEKD